MTERSTDRNADISRAIQRVSDPSTSSPRKVSSEEASHPPAAEVLVGSTFLGLGLFMVVTALSFGTEARRLPLVVGIPMTVIATMNLGVQLLAARGHRANQKASGPVSSLTGPLPSAGLSLATVLGLLVVLSGLFFTLGLFLTAPIYVFALMRIIGKQPLIRTLLVSGVFAVMLYLFSWGFGVHVYGGIIDFDLFGMGVAG